METEGKSICIRGRGKGNLKKKKECLKKKLGRRAGRAGEYDSS